MNTSRHAVVPALLLLLACLSRPAQAGEVYKCQGPGGTVYQDLPCPEDPTRPPQARFDTSLAAAPASAPAGAEAAAAKPAQPQDQKQLVQVYDGLKQAEKDKQALEAQMNSEIAAAKAEHASDPAAANAAIDAINAKFGDQVDDLNTRQDQLATQARQLCPNSEGIASDGTCK
jgi:hypothetical protein